MTCGEQTRESETDGQFLAELDTSRAGDDGEAAHVENLRRKREKTC